MYKKLKKILYMYTLTKNIYGIHILVKESEKNYMHVCNLSKHSYIIWQL